MAQAEHIQVAAPRSVALFDLSYSFRRHWHAQAADAEINDAPKRVLEELARTRDAVEHVIVCCDSPPYFRKKLYPEYKAQREAPSDGMKAAMAWLKERIDRDGYQVAKAETFEADDVIATLADKLFELGCQDIRMVGSDKDLSQCVGGAIRQFVPAIGDRPEVVMGPAQVTEKFGVFPQQMAEYQALVGDTGDNIPGVKGIGPKGAAKILQAYGTLAAMYADLESDSDRDLKCDLNEKLISALRIGKAQVFRDAELTTLRTDVPLDVTALLQRKEVKPISGGRMQAVEEAEFEEKPKQQADDVPISPPPGVTRLTPLPPKPETRKEPEPRKEQEAIVRASNGHGLVTADLQPQDLKAARNIALWVHDSRLYEKFNNPEAIFTIIMRGKELGLGAMTALDSFHLVEGKPCASAQLIIALAQRSKRVEYMTLVEVTNEQATWEAKLVGRERPVTYTYTIKDAEAAGLTKPSKRTGEPSNWVKRPKDMLIKTAGAKLARIVDPGGTMGLYDPDEMEAA